MPASRRQSGGEQGGKTLKGPPALPLAAQVKGGNAQGGHDSKRLAASLVMYHNKSHPSITQM